MKDQKTRSAKRPYSKRTRLDFEISLGDEPGEIRMVLNRRRYDPIRKAGKVVAYKDKKTNEIITIENLRP